MRITIGPRLFFKSLTLVATVAFVTGCDGESVAGVALEGPPGVSVRYARLIPGAVAPVSLHNRSVRHWDYTPCSFSLDRLTDGAWIPNVQEGPLVCAAVNSRLHPGERVTANVNLPNVLGTYRVRFHFQSDIGFDRIEATSNLFEVGYASADAAARQ